MNHRLTNICICFISLILTSCTLYKPQLADIPLISQKGDVQAAAAVYVLPEPGLDATISVGLTNHLAAQVHTNIDFIDVHYAHTALGLYFPYEKSTLETYLGVGHGNGSVYIDADPAGAEGPYLCGFLQANYGWHLSPKSAFGFSFKGGALFPEIDYYCPGYENGAVTTISGVDREARFFIEPQLFYRIGGECVKFQIQLGFNQLINKPEYNVLRYIPVSLSTGISIHF
ncbi:MAG: hypothetical protein J6T88_04670 [Bacteroidales bacterium]|nr:hypothetical protein [Bacteroidales bacterium]